MNAIAPPLARSRDCYAASGRPFLLIHGGSRMPWHIGIDEAGYGPNLGPFVMTLVACRCEEADLWTRLKSGVRRFDEPADHRLIVADSKQVYAPARGWAELERTVLAARPWQEHDEP